MAGGWEWIILLGMALVLYLVFRGVRRRSNTKPTRKGSIEPTRVQRQKERDKTLPQVPRKSMTQPRDILILDEYDVGEEVVVVGTEDFPLDNTYGTDTLSVEYEVSKTVTNEVWLSSEMAGNLSLGANLFGQLKAEIAGKLTRKVGHSVGETVTRRQTLKFSVLPKHAVTYTVVWNRKTRKGKYRFRHGAEVKFIPYEMNYDLQYQVRTSE